MLDELLSAVLPPCVFSILHIWLFFSLAQKLKGLVEQYEVREQVSSFKGAFQIV